ncbi:phosphate ABC transporter permease subunit PstC [Pontivivens insulae]|uniref:Phosphate transport system permease protein n=1 Tax=Pontivivens insulae TaxID=1639689 RepID=A0A2R8A753_9RHOB|nr:phosphate ABC transporter permease subunit PstC [Pontivivens insulae]RED18167.1 phosphate ABC transporter membrane protein 1 (PhoT family) [Pontivivens insulae]SPF28064.1 Phosphate transport system permease protein PstC 1 [Pontivivens insulae]
MLLFTFIAIALLALGGYMLSRGRAIALADGRLARLHSRPSYHGLYSLLWTALVGIAVLLIVGEGWLFLNQQLFYGMIADALPDEPFIAHQLVLSDARAIAAGQVASTTDALRTELADTIASMESLRIWVTCGLALLSAGAAWFLTYSRISLEWRARNRSEQIIQVILAVCAVIAILTTIGIVLSLISETLNFFSKIGWRVDMYLFGTTWSPLSGVSAGALDPEKVGAVPLFAGTFMITIIAMLVAVPVGLFAAIYLSDFASKRTRSWAKPMLEVLAGVPTVVYGFFAAITVAPAIRDAGTFLGLNVDSSSALAAGTVMGIMIIPFISSLSDDVINSVPQSLRDGSYGLGATKAETIRQVVLPAALPGIVSAILLGISRAVGETMIVVMAAGQGANLTWNPLEAVTTVTVQIVMLYTGDTDLETASGPVFALGFTLFCVTLLLNVVALRIVRRYREMYD